MKIVVLDGWTLNPGDNPWTELEDLGELVVYPRTSPAELIERADGAQVLVINKVRLSSDEFELLPDLRFVTVTATGHDCVDTQAAERYEVAVANVPIYGTDSVAQHVLAMLLHVLHRIDLHDTAVRAGEWAERGDFSFWKSPLVELRGKTMGIIGFGRIGRRVGQLTHALGMRVLAHTRSPDEGPSYDDFSWCELIPLVERSDVISLNCPLTDATHGMVNRDFLGRCKPTAILINASRGPLVIEDDLAAALKEGELAAACVDVVSVEPIKEDNPLLRAPNCFITPHLAWATIEARRRLMRITVDNIKAFVAGHPQNLV